MTVATYRVEPMNDRVALIHDTATDTTISELMPDQAEQLSEALRVAVRMVRRAHPAWG